MSQPASSPTPSGPLHSASPEDKPITQASQKEATHPSEVVSNLPDQLQQSIVGFEGFVKLVAENLRYGSWTKRIVTIGGVAVVGLNPLSAGKVAETFGVKELPQWYGTAFWGGLAGLGGVAVAAAVVTLPKKPGAEVDTSQNRAIKGLRSFELKDADIFAKLERQRDVQECYEAVTAPGFRFGVLMGESGCGKSSLLQAGLLPRLLGEAATHRGVYVKMGDRAPLEAIRVALRKELGETAVGETGADLLTMVTQAARVTGKPLVLILDQFEQFFVQYKRVEERAAFIQALKAWYVSEVPVRILIGIREDLASRLIELQRVLRYSLGPGEVFRLEKFSPGQVTAVLREMARLEGLDFNEPFVEELARKEMASREDGLILPVDVQVLAWMIVRQSEAELRAFNQKSFQRLGGVEGLLQAFLERTLAALMGKAQRALAVEILLALTDRERNVRAGMLALGELYGKLEGKGLPVEIGEMVEWLARGDVRLVTAVERETGLGYELAHERLIPALLRVAGKELSAADQANQLLNRRVNEWLGNGRSNRYRFDWQELKLLHRHRNTLVWGEQRQWKEELLAKSWRQFRRKASLWASPAVLMVCLWGYSLTTPGTLQMLRCQLGLMWMWGGNSLNVGSDLSSALTLDMIAETKGKPFPNLWLRWFAAHSYDSQTLENVVKLAAKSKNSISAKQLLKQVEVVVNESDRPYLEAKMMAKIVEAYATLKDSSKAQEALSQSIKVAQAIQDEYSKSSALSAIAKAASTLKDSSKAQEILAQALKAAQAIQDERTKSSALIAIAQASATLKDSSKAQEVLAQSLTAAQAIKDENFKSSALRAIAQARATLKGSTKAQSPLTVRPQPFAYLFFPLEDGEARQLIFKAQAAATLKDSSKAQEVLSQSIKAAQAIQGERTKSQVLSVIANAAATLKDSNKAQEVLSQALKAAQAIQGEKSKSEILISTSTGLNFKDRVKKQSSLPTLPEPFASALAPVDESYKFAPLIAIAEAAATLKDSSKAQEVLSQSLKAAQTIQTEFNKYQVLREIAQAAATLKDSSKAQEVLSQSLKAAQAIQDESSKSQALSAIAEAYATLKDSSKAQEVLAQSIKVAQAIQDESSKSHALRAIAQASATLKDSSKAQEVLAQSLKATQAIQVEGYKSEALSAIAETYIKLNDIPNAKKVLNEASKLLRDRCSLGDPYAELGEFHTAYRFAQECGTTTKLSTFAKILTVHAEQLNPELKQLRDKP